MAIAVKVLDHRHPRLGKQTGYPAFHPQDDHIDVLPHGNQMTNGRPVGGLDHLYGLGRQTGRHQRLPHQRSNRLIAVNRLGTAAQDSRVTGLQAQRRGVRGDIRARLVDDTDYPQRHPHLSNLYSARAGISVR